MRHTVARLAAVAIGTLLVCAFVPRWAPASAAAGSRDIAPAPPPQCQEHPGVIADLGVPYMDDGNPHHTLDAWLPAGASGEPAVVVIHGGGWRSGSSSALCRQAIYFAQNGLAAFSVNYTLSTPDEPTWPLAFQEVIAATTWVASEAPARYGVDGSRIGGFGTSAGGHLAALVDTRGPDQGAPLLTSVPWSGVMDLKKSYDESEGTRVPISQFLGCNPDDQSCARKASAASPITWVSGGDGSMLIFNSTNEVIPLDQAQDMDEALGRAGVGHRLVAIPGSAHASAYQCVDVTIGGVTMPVIDATVRRLGLVLFGHPITPTGTFCGA